LPTHDPNWSAGGRGHTDGRTSCDFAPTRAARIDGGNLGGVGLQAQRETEMLHLVGSIAMRLCQAGMIS
jgi:hypothetical protein